MIDINATLLLTILNFILLVIVLRLILFGPLAKFLDERSRTIAESLKQAEENRRRSGEMNAEKDAVIAEARRKASDIIEKATAGAHDESHEIIRKAREETKKTVASAQKEIAEEADRVKRELRREVAEITLSLAEKVLKREIDAKEHRKLIEDGLEVLDR